MIKYYDLGFTTVEVHQNYLTNTISSGFLVLPEHNKILLEFVNTHFNNRNFVYISNRIHSYSVNPTIYHETKKIDNMLGIAVVSKNPRQKLLSELEGSFYKKDLKYFSSMIEALRWKDALLKKAASV